MECEIDPKPPDKNNNSRDVNAGFTFTTCSKKYLIMMIKDDIDNKNFNNFSPFKGVF